MNKKQDYKRYMDEIKKQRKFKIAKFKNREYFMDRLVQTEKDEKNNKVRIYEKTPNKLVKGKVHCSCDVCTPKTKVSGWKHSDKRKKRALKNQLESFLETTQYNIKNLKCLNN
jgi:hypothetical protein